MADLLKEGQDIDQIGARPAQKMRRAIVAIPIAISLIWLVIVTGIAHSQGRAKPAIAHAVWSFDARASAAFGRALLINAPTPSNVSTARSLALQAFKRDPTVLAAYTILGLNADIAGQRPVAERIFRFAHRLSRRDLATELWLIEASVAQDDVAGALNHFDAAISTSANGWATLTPILLSALDDPQLVVPIAELAAKRRWWAADFEMLVAAKAPSLENATRFFVRLSTLRVPPNAAALQSLVARLVNNHMPRHALLLDGLLVTDRRYDHIRDGGFDRERGLRPFQWNVADNDQAFAERTGRPDQPGNGALGFTVEAGAKRALARQLVALPAGRYVLATDMLVEEGSGDWTLGWTITCESTAREASSVSWQAKNAIWEKRVGQITIPRDCPFQWVSLWADSGNSATRLKGWVDNILVTARN